MAREIQPPRLDFAMAPVRPYGETGDQTYEAAALRSLERYVAEEKPSLLDVAGTVALLAERQQA